MSKYSIDNFRAIYTLLTDELMRANKIHPLFSQYCVQAVSIMAEECGEAIQAANDLSATDNDANRVKLRKELIHTGAMVFRCLIELDLIGERYASTRDNNQPSE